MACFDSYRWMVVLCACVVGCSSSDGDAASATDTDPGEATSDNTVDVSSLDDPLQAGQIEYANAYCDCYWESAGFDSRDQCVQSNDGFTTGSCEADALFGQDAAKPRLQCIYDAAMAKTQCVTDSMCGDEEAVAQMCDELEREQLSQCPDYPSDVQSAISACNEPEPFWMVGDDGVVFGIDETGNAHEDPQDTQADFYAIACDGAERAWIAGDEGTVLRTVDAGRSWQVEQTPTLATLRAVAQRGGLEIAAVGDAGTVVVSDDGGLTWTSVAGAQDDFTGVAASGAETWLMSSEQGSLWSWSARDGFVQTHVSSQPLHAVASDHHGPIAAAVGAEGALFVSPDAGTQWFEVESETTRDLRAVNVLDAGQLIAVGDRGTVVVVGPEGTTIESLGSDDLLGLHVNAKGVGAAVGARGRFVSTTDGGITWKSADLGLTADLRGLDQPRPHH